jgi:hypothetical protein
MSRQRDAVPEDPTEGWNADVLADWSGAPPEAGSSWAEGEDLDEQGCIARLEQNGSGPPVEEHISGDARDGPRGSDDDDDEDLSD